MSVVSNTSPILNLAIINRLDLLRQQFGEVLIPPAVLSELKADTDFLGADRIREALLQAWLQARELTNVNLARVLNRDLDQGEAETIALALEFGLDTV
jgi:predicted nucleic acid-binding protein